MTALRLATEFPPATHEQWRGLVDRVLKGADYERTLVGRTADGRRIEPLSPKAEGAVPTGRAAHGPWRVAARADAPDPADANALLLADLEGGADAVVLTFAGAAAARGFGLPSPDPGVLERVLADVMLDGVSVRLEAGDRGSDAALALLDLAERRGHDPASLDIDLGLDPIGVAATVGRDGPDENALGRLARTAAERGFANRVLLADGRPYHEAGASEAEELAATLATGIAYLRGLEGGGLDLDAARRRLSFMLVADTDQFLTIAKLRAFRRLWAAVEAACGLEPRPAHLGAESAWRALTRRDPWVNLLRGAASAFSAGVGGADTVGVLPFTAALGLPDAFARRLARSTQLILLEEANLWRVADPAAGSGSVEALTDDLAAEASDRLREIEREGGIVTSLRTGALPGRIAGTRATRTAAVARRRLPITGTSEFPDLAEAAVAVLAGAPSSPVHHPEVTGSVEPTPKGEPVLPSFRLAEPFEALRDASDRALADTGTRPRVFLVNLGPAAAFTARASFARNAFEAGGVEAVTNDGYDDLDAMAAAFAASGCRLACLCSSDQVYAAEAAPAAAALRAAGAAAIYLAGRPGEAAPEWRDAGMTDFVFTGCDLLALLEAAQERALA